MKCGERGFKTVTGEPCGQEIGARAAGCLWHSRTAEERSLLATKGALASRMRRFLPTTTPPPEFGSTAAIVTWAQETAQRVLSGALDPRAASEARQLAALTIQARSADAQERLVDALLKLEHGGAAMLLLSRLTDGGAGRPLPGRVLSMVPAPAGDPA